MSADNSNFETVYVDSKKVACSGGEGSLGHPTVYLNMGEKDFVICPYCSKHFIIKKTESFNTNLKNT